MGVQCTLYNCTIHIQMCSQMSPTGTIFHLFGVFAISLWSLYHLSGVFGVTFECTQFNPIHHSSTQFNWLLISQTTTRCLFSLNCWHCKTEQLRQVQQPQKMVRTVCSTATRCLFSLNCFVLCILFSNAVGACAIGKL